MLVVDASALVDLLVVDPADLPRLAERLVGVDWMSAPDLIDYEVLNALRKLVNVSHIDIELAESAIIAIGDLRLTRHPLTPELTERIWDLRHNVSAYDAAYVALAERLTVPLVTTDRRLANATRGLTSASIECLA